MVNTILNSHLTRLFSHISQNTPKEAAFAGKKIDHGQTKIDCED